MTKDSRPVNLNLLTIRFPIPAIVSILHRLSGVFTFLLTPFLLWLLQYSLTLEGFTYLQTSQYSAWFHFLFWLFIAPFLFHFIAGFRHLLLDLHLGEDLASGRKSATLTILFAVLLIIVAGIWIW